jgi:RNA polymerase sigma-70 factor (ECF subfamily)
MQSFGHCTDEQLLLLLSQGDTGAFDELYGRYSQRLFAFFRRMFRSDAEKAEDAVQDLFVKIIERPARFNTELNFSSWVFSVAYNMCKNEYKHQTIVNGAHIEIRQTSTRNDASFFKNIAERIDRKEFRRLLQDELELLHADKRTAFLLKYQEHKSIKEIAQIMDCSEGTVKSRIFYTAQHLARQLAVFNPKT